MAVRDALKRDEIGRSTGQAAVEFVLSLLFILIITAALFQALFFELDVFNQSAVARYQFVSEVHRNPDRTPCRSFSTPFQGRTVGQFAPWSVPYQTVNRNQRYGPKRIHGERGSKYFDRLTIGGVGAHGYGWLAVLQPDHRHGSAGRVTPAIARALTILSLEIPAVGC